MDRTIGFQVRLGTGRPRARCRHDVPLVACLPVSHCSQSLSAHDTPRHQDDQGGRSGGRPGPGGAVLSAAAGVARDPAARVVGLARPGRVAGGVTARLARARVRAAVMRAALRGRGARVVRARHRGRAGEQSALPAAAARRRARRCPLACLPACLPAVGSAAPCRRCRVLSAAVFDLARPLHF